MRRLVPGLLATVVLAIGTLLPAPALASTATAMAAPGDPPCSVEQWQQGGLTNFQDCVDRLQDVAAARAQCLTAPNPAAPDAGFAGWFVSAPSWENNGQGIGRDKYSRFGYAAYDYTTYDIGCASTLMHPDYKFENTIANGEFMIAGGIIAAANGLRERAWDPGTLWSWADPLVEKATQGIYSKVFSVFGLVTLAVIGIYLMWRARRAEMSAAVTTVGWALVVMVAVTAIAKWPVASANMADSALTSTLGVVHDAVGPSGAIDATCNVDQDPMCKDFRPPAVRASDTAVNTLLYRNWLRGLLGSADSDTAKKYGNALYVAKSLSWTDIERLKSIPDPAERQVHLDDIVGIKKANWMKVSEQIKAEDPQAYEYLQGTKGMERIGAGFVAILSSLAYALFDIIASILVLLGFLIFRWAVIAAPALGTVGMMRPASAGIRRLAGAVLAAVFNIAIFGTGAAVYLSAVDMIMSTPSLPGWLQVTLVLLCGVVGWILLRPYRRITQLGGATPAQGWGRELLRPSSPSATSASKTVEARVENRVEGRPEATTETKVTLDIPEPELAPRTEGLPEQRRWNTADVPDNSPAQVLYRPSPVAEPTGSRPQLSRSEGVAEEAAPTRPAIRTEAR